MSDNNDKIPSETPADAAVPATPEAAQTPPPSAGDPAATLPLQPTQSSLPAQPTMSTAAPQPTVATGQRPLWRRTGARIAAASVAAVLLLGGGFGAGWAAASGASMVRTGFAEDDGPGVAPWDQGDRPENGMPGRGDGADRGQGGPPHAPGTRQGRDEDTDTDDDGDDDDGSSQTPDSDS